MRAGDEKQGRVAADLARAGATPEPFRAGRDDARAIAVVRALQQLPPEVWDRADIVGPPVVAPLDVSEAPSIAPLAIDELSIAESSEPSVSNPPSGESR